MTTSGRGTPNRCSITAAYGSLTVATRLARRAQRRSTAANSRRAGPGSRATFAAST